MWIYLWICLWVNTYRYIFSGMNINLPAILGFTRYQGFDPSPYYLDKLLGWWYVHVYGIIIVHEMGIPTNNTNRKWVWEMMISSGNQTWQVKILHCWMILPFKSFPWIFYGKNHGFLMGKSMVLMGKPSINDGSSIATFDETRGSTCQKPLTKQDTAFVSSA